MTSVMDCTMARGGGPTDQNQCGRLECSQRRGVRRLESHASDAQHKLRGGTVIFSRWLTEVATNYPRWGGGAGAKASHEGPRTCAATLLDLQRFICILGTPLHLIGVPSTCPACRVT